MSKQGEKLYITATEYKESYGGFREKRESERHILSFDCCNIGLTRIEPGNFTCTRAGTMFDILNIIPYIQKNHKNPVTGEPLEIKDLFKLNLKRGQGGKYIDPITANEFNDMSHIVAIGTTGNVYDFDSIQEMNLSVGDFKDFLSDTPFKVEDIITIQDPKNRDRREQNLTNFHHIKEVAKSKDVEDANKRVNMTSETNRIMSRVKQGPDTREVMYKSEARGPSTKSASLTSSSMNLLTKDVEIDRSDQIKQDAIYSIIKKKKMVGLVTLHTNMGDMGFELFCSAAPKTCDNFLTLCERGYYDQTSFHRLIKNFMLQGGDPTGTGRGGSSIWNKPFEDEFSKHLHDSIGTLSMANSGKATNKSQFFITFGPAAHLDRKHTVFGKLITGQDVLKEIEKIPTGDQDKPKVPIVIQYTTVVKNPYIEAATIESEKEKKQSSQNKTSEYGQWFSNPSPSLEPQNQGVGKFLKLETPSTQVEKRKQDGEPFVDKKKVRKDFDFSSW